VPTEYAESVEDEFNYLVDWKEAVGSENAPSSTGALSMTDQTGTLVGYVPFNKLRSACRYFVGHTTADIRTPWRLHREPPAHYPLYPQMRCYAVGFQPRILKANSDGSRFTELAYGIPIGEIANVPNIDTPWLDWLGNPVRTGNYREAVLTLSFRSFGRVAFSDDSRIETYRDEWKRYVKWSVDPQTEVLSADGASQLKFAEGEPETAGASGGPVIFPVPIAEVLAKAAYSATIFNLPFDYLSSSTQFLYPKMILQRLGTINSESFCGHPTGTLLLSAAKIEEVLFPIAPDLPDYPSTGYTVTLMFEQFDPPKGVTGSEYRGHRVFPWRKDGKWYYCTRQGSSREMLPMTDFHKILKNANDPSL